MLEHIVGQALDGAARDALDRAALEGAGAPLAPVTLRIPRWLVVLALGVALLFGGLLGGWALSDEPMTLGGAALGSMFVAAFACAALNGAVWSVHVDERGFRGRDALTLRWRDVRWEDVLAFRLRSGFLRAELRDGSAFRLHPNALGMARFAGFAFACAGEATVTAVSFLDRLVRGEPEKVAILRRLRGE